MEITSLMFLDDADNIINIDESIDTETSKDTGAGRHMIATCDNGTAYRIDYIGEAGTDLRYTIRTSTGEEITREQRQELVTAIMKYECAKTETILYQIEYGPYITANLQYGADSCFFANIGITGGDISDFRGRFKKTRTDSEKNFFSIILHSSPEYDNNGNLLAEGHVSTLIVCTDRTITATSFLLDTSYNVHQQSNAILNKNIPLDAEINTIKPNIIKNTTRKIACLSIIPRHELQSGNCCTVWTSIINSKLAQHRNITEVIDIRNNCLQPNFFNEILDELKRSSPIGQEFKFINRNNCNALEQKILELQQQNPVVQQQQEQPAQNIQNQLPRPNRGHHAGIEQNQQDGFDRILDSIQENRTNLHDTQNQRTQTRQQKKNTKKQKQL